MNKTELEGTTIPIMLYVAKYIGKRWIFPIWQLKQSIRYG